MGKCRKWNLLFLKDITLQANRGWFGIFHRILHNDSIEAEKYKAKQSEWKPRSSNFKFSPETTTSLKIIPLLWLFNCAAFGLITPSVAFAYTFANHDLPSPNPDAVYDYDLGKHLFYTSTNYDTTHELFDTAQEACEDSTPAPFGDNVYLYTYSNPRAGVDPDYGYGCYYRQVTTIASGPNEGQVVEDDPNVFQQHWYGYSFICPDGFQPLDIEKGPAGFGYEYGTAVCGKPVPLFVTVIKGDDPKNLGGSCPAKGELRVGDPVNPATGNKYETEIDYKRVGFSPLHWSRTYNSRARDNGFWTHSYSARLKPVVPQTQAPPNIIKSSTTNSLTVVCSTKWYEIRASAATEELRQSHGVYDADKGMCALYDSSNNNIGYTSIYTDYSPPRWPKLYDNKLDLVRPDGREYEFVKMGDIWTSDADVLGTLTETDDANGFPIGWKYTTKDNTIEAYDAAGKLISITDPNGMQQTLKYSDAATPSNIAPQAGLMIGVTDSFGHTLNITYDANARIQTVSDPATNTIGYTYDADGDISTVTYPDGETQTYLYNEPAHTSGTDLPHALTGIIDENGGRYATTEYDTQGRAISTEHAGVANTAIAYNLDGSATVTDALGTARTYTFNTINGVAKYTSMSQPCALCGGDAAQSMSYDVNGNVASKTDFNGVTTIYTYDMTRNLETSRTEAVGTPQERTITTQWHPTFRLPTLITEPGKTTAFTYDSAGNLTQKTITDTSTNTSRTWHYTYNAFGLVTSVDGPRTDISDVTTYGYDTQGNLTTITNALNQVTHITSYDADSRPLTIVDPNGLTTTLTYAPRGWLTSRAVSDGTTTETTTYDYDGVGQLTKVILPDASYISYTYDAAHRLTGIADSLGNHIDYTLDAMGNRTQENVYDPGNTMTQTRSHVYNALNKLAQDIGAQNQTTDYSYDNNGNLTSVSDPLGHTTTKGYDALNRLVQVTDPNNGMTHYGYDANDHLTSVTDPRNIHTTYDYDALNDLDQQMSPDTGTTTNRYDAAGNIITATDARGVVTEYAYDALNRLISKSYPASPADNVTYSYDQGINGIGRLTAIIPADGNRIDYRYDGYGNVIDETRLIQGVTFDTRYTYDTRNRLATITYPSGRIIAYGRDTQGRISSITTQADAQAPLQTVANQISYQPFGPVAGLTYGNGQVMHMTYNLDGRITDIRDDGTNGAIDDNQLDYDPAGDIAAITDVLDSARNQTYTYDALQRLTQAVGDYGQIDYGYDSVGNRTDRNLSQGTHTEKESYTYDTASNRLQQISRQIDGVSGTRLFGYDAIGNIIADALDTDTFTFAYNSANRLTAVGDMAQYSINPLGQREFKHVYIGIPNDANGDGVLNNDDIKYVRDYIRNGGAYNSQYDCDNNGVLDRLDPRCMRQTLNAQRKGDIATPQAVNINMAYTYDQHGRLLQAYNVDTGQVENEYIYLAGRPIAVVTGGSLYFIHTDQLNTPRVITDNTDKIIWRWDSDPFGTTAANDDPDGDGIKFSYNLRFPGQYYDQETGLNYNYFRDYDPSTGRYIESDPVGLVGGLNTYAYVDGNPISLVDPYGLRDVNVYIWRAEGTSVGHVMVTETNSTQVILSQFPSNGMPWGPNQTKDFAHTMAAEARPPSEIWQVYVPNDRAFDQEAARERGLSLWSWSPSDSSTQCSIAASRALEAGGVGINTITTGTLLPGFFANNLQLNSGNDMRRLY